VSLAIIGELMAATAGAHSPRALVRAIANVLGRHAPIERVELSEPAPRIAAVRVAGDWQCVESVRSSRSCRALARGLAIAAPPLAWLADGEFRAALGEVIAATARHLEVIERVAGVSRRAYGEARELRADLDRATSPGELVVRSTAMRDAVARLELVAKRPTTVLLVGESGVGKEAFARELHRRSPRAHHSLVQLNCGALPDSLLDSELFGHERGAFTGADRQHAGAFEQAHRGTLFLDEVGELSPAAQVKLLRVLQERAIRRVGGTEQLDVDVRLVAATNRDLAAMVRDGKFRSDLLYRLDVFSIRVPALRERRGDIAVLVASIVRRLAAKLRVDPPPITRSLLARLAAHSWPGNVRELANVLEAAMVLGDGTAIELPAELTRKRDPSRELDAAIRSAIEDALVATSGKIYGDDGAAARLGLPPATLQSKMKKLGVARAAFTRRNRAA
jgi:formate hydrogenlyase transcriptional activator